MSADTRTAAQKKTAARKHHLAGLYHNAFLCKSSPVVGEDVTAHAATKLVRNGWAMINTFPLDDGTIMTVLGRTKTGSKNYDVNCTLRDGSESISTIPRYSRILKVDMSALMNTTSTFSPLYMKKWY